MTQKTPTIKKQMLEVMIEYTETFLIPLLDDRFDTFRNEFRHELKEEIGSLRHELKEEIGSLRHELKDYVDKKLADQTSDIFRRLDRRDQKNIKFKQKVVTVFKDNDLASSKDLTYLVGLANA